MRAEPREINAALQHGPARPESARRAEPSHTPLERATLLAVLYADLFDYPLTRKELRQSLIGERASSAALESVVESLTGDYLEHTAVDCGELESEGGFVTWLGRSEIVETRLRRRRLSADRWRQARRFARWLARVPFVRCIAVCGSLAVENGDTEGDIDLFCITAPRRLWIVQLSAMVLRRFAALGGTRVCPNYLVTLDHLEVYPRNLYLAHEITQVMPLSGGEAYDRFIAANGWALRVLPNTDLDGRKGRLERQHIAASTRWCERLLSGRLGEVLDVAIHRTLSAYYTWRLRRHGWTPEMVRSTYRRERQEVMAGGYGPVIEHRFCALVEKRLGKSLARSLERDVFPAASIGRPTADPLYVDLFDRRYDNAPHAGSNRQSEHASDD